MPGDKARDLTADLTELRTTQEQHRDAIDRLERLLFIGNGREPVTVAMGALEERVVALERKCQPTARPDKDKHAGRTSTIMLWTALISAVSAIVCAWLTGAK